MSFFSIDRIQFFIFEFYLHKKNYFLKKEKLLGKFFLEIQLPAKKKNS